MSMDRATDNPRNKPKTISLNGVPHPIIHLQAMSKEIKPQGDVRCFEPTQEFTAVTLLVKERHVWHWKAGGSSWELCL